MSNAQFTTYQEQIEILKKDGLTINHLEKAEQILKKHNYYTLKKYRNIIYDTNASKYKSGATIEDLYELYNLDMNIKSKFLIHLLECENTIKSIIAHNFADKYGHLEVDYNKLSNFHLSSVHNCETFIKFNDKIKNYKTRTGESNVTPWELISETTFGFTRSFFDALVGSLKKKIRDEFDFQINISEGKVKNYIDKLLNARNVCAHDSVFLYFNDKRPIPLNDWHRNGIFSLSYDNKEYVKGRTDLFAVMITMKLFMDSESFNDLIDSVDYSINKAANAINCVSYNDILDKVGLPMNYTDLKKC